MYSMPSLPEKRTEKIRENITLEAFFSLISDSDRAFLLVGELDRFIPTCCAMGNGGGGWIVLGATLKEDDLPLVEGVPDAASLEEQLTLFLQDSGIVNPVSYFRVISSAGKKIMAARIEPAG